MLGLEGAPAPESSKQESGAGLSSIIGCGKSSAPELPGMLRDAWSTQPVPSPSGESRPGARFCAESVVGKSPKRVEKHVSRRFACAVDRKRHGLNLS